MTSIDESILYKGPHRRRVGVRQMAACAVMAVIPALAVAEVWGAELAMTVWRVVGIYAIILASLRLLGKREFSQLSPIELICLILIPDLVSQGVVGESPTFMNAIVALSTLFMLVALTSTTIQLSDRIERVLISEPSVLVKDGRLIEKHLKSEVVTPDEILTAARRQGYCKLEDIRYAVLETDGTITIVPRDNL